jgi:hypothetical protein
MGFTTPCIIRKNTTKIRDRLKELDYNCNPYLGWHNLYTTIHGYASVYSMNDDDINVLSKKIDSFIDCGTNEELFLAIAALRDDTDDNQWFTDGNDWFLCRYLKVGMHYQDMPEILFEKWYKATVEELIKHFKEKEE